MIFVLYLHFFVHVTIFSKANEWSTTISVLGLINKYISQGKEKNKFMVLISLVWIVL